MKPQANSFYCKIVSLNMARDTATVIAYKISDMNFNEVFNDFNHCNAI